MDQERIDQITNAAITFNSKKETAREAVKLTLEAVAKELLVDSLNDSVLRQAHEMVSNHAQVSLYLEKADKEIQRLQRALSLTADIKNVNLDERAMNALGLFSTMIDLVTKNPKFTRTELEPRVQVELLRVASFSVWAYLGGSGKPSQIESTIDAE